MPAGSRRARLAPGSSRRAWILASVAPPCASGPTFAPYASALPGSAPIHTRPQARCATTELPGGPPYSSCPPFSHFISLKSPPTNPRIGVLAGAFTRIGGTEVAREGGATEALGRELLNGAVSGEVRFSVARGEAA